MFNLSKPIWISAALLGIAFALEQYTPLGIAHAVIYAPIIALAGLSRSLRALVGLTAIALLCVWGALLISPVAPSGMPYGYIVVNRVLSSVAIIVVAIIVFHLIVKKQAKAQIASELVNTNNEISELLASLPLIVWTTFNGEDIQLLNVGKAGDKQQISTCSWKALLAAIAQEERGEIEAKWQEGLASGQRFNFTAKVIRPSGAERIYAVEGVPVSQSGSGDLYWNGTFSDVTEYALLQLNNEATVQKLNATLTGITDAFFILDQDMRFVYANDKARNILGCTTDEVQNRYLHDIISVLPDCPLIEKCHQAAKEQEVLSTTEYYPLHDMWVMQNIFPTEDGLTVYISDVSDVYRKERELRLLHAAVSKLNDIVLIAEVDTSNPDLTKTIFVNEAFELKTGYSKSDIIGKNPTLLCEGAGDEADVYKIRNQLAQNSAVRTQVLNYTKSGQELWLDMDIVPITDERGVYTHWVAVERDITEQKKLEAQLNRAQRMESIGFLTGGIAHDFNNLLTVFTGTTELLVESLDYNVELKQIAETALKAAERGKALTSSLLAFSRKQSLNPTSFSVSSMLDNLMPLIKSSVGEKVTVEVINLTSHYVTADLSQLENSVINLLLNARDAMETGGVVKITLTDKQFDQVSSSYPDEPEPGHYVSIMVTDTGTGIPEDCKEHVFDPFFTTKTKGKGTGLGLSTVYGFIKQSKGHIYIDSQIGVGTSIELLLPIAKQSQHSSNSVTSLSTPVRKGRKILVVEDDKEVLDYVSARLKSVGYNVTVASDASSALDELNKNPCFDLVFSDIVMPGPLDGVELAEVCKKNWPALPVLLTSGFNDYNHQQEILQKSDVEILAKPYQRDDLLQKIFDTMRS